MLHIYAYIFDKIQVVSKPERGLHSLPPELHSGLRSSCIFVRPHSDLFPDVLIPVHFTLKS